MNIPERRVMRADTGQCHRQLYTVYTHRERASSDLREERPSLLTHWTEPCCPSAATEMKPLSETDS